LEIKETGENLVMNFVMCSSANGIQFVKTSRVREQELEASVRGQEKHLRVPW
jgi:hypothetical protein